MDFEADLVRALQEDGRASIHSLALRLGQSRAAVSTRLRAMLADGTVRVVAAVDPAFLGQHVLAHVSVRADGSVQPIAEHLRGLPETVLVSAVGGSHDLVTEVRVGSMATLHELLARIRGLSGVVDISTLIYSTVVKGFFVSDYQGDLVIDDIDMSLIEMLQRDGRMSYRALGEAVRLSPSAVTTRVQRLIAGGVIKISAVEARGLAHRQLSMGVGLNLSGEDDAVIDALREWRGVDFAARTLGRFDAVATLVEPTAGALYASLERLRTLPGVARMESWLHLAVLKEDYARTLRPAAR
ncbi:MULTISPECIES: Lrp/AsnC family transcriptional regulator [Microbacterium]|uniref:AsnC family transcriptional regulator n=1 Tax=Microbacterium barkeri TaxID=33917 RepID=A0A9W6LWB8_9MICO|nr:Lrp/AsnC family transcriptional regulator [Microbacterium barkeri]MDR6875522.1 DNA-binding Lrp family transcriptional regulator [Microbacterium barkeri]GLJ61629.1 AsnC family transcriptional regulator [Microbacterium barkeri]